MSSFLGRDILSLKDFDRDELDHILEVADEMAPIARRRRNTDLLKDKILAVAFYQPSTRTRLAHEAAMLRLGGRVTGYSDAKMTRAGDFYQETIKDTVKMLECYGDVIVMRHFQQGAPHEAARWAEVPIINGGDGWGEHHTQILTDLYTVQQAKGGIDGLNWLAVGDMRMRTMHSLAYALTKFDCPITFVAPPELSLTDEFKTELQSYDLDFREVDHVEQAIAEADVILVEPVVQPDYTKSRGQLQDLSRASRNQGQARRRALAFAAPHGRDPHRCRRQPLGLLLAGSLQRRGDADGAAGPGPGGQGLAFGQASMRRRAARSRTAESTRAGFSNRDSRIIAAMT
jgi:aspartate carbamoyltransferase catalytic subunit